MDSNDTINQQTQEYVERDWEHMSPDRKAILFVAYKDGARRKITSAEIESAAKVQFETGNPNAKWEDIDDSCKYMKELHRQAVKAVLRSIGHEIEGDE